MTGKAVIAKAILDELHRQSEEHYSNAYVEAAAPLDQAVLDGTFNLLRVVDAIAAISINRG